MERVKCANCDNMPLLSTAQKNGGLCAVCAKYPPQPSDRERDESLASGAVFEPGELGDDTLLGHETGWTLEPSYYANRGISSVEEALKQASSAKAGDVFLKSDEGNWLALSFTGRFGACTFQSEELGVLQYAHGPGNAKSQVPPEEQITWNCPCCGVGMGWLPSRFHMSREKAFETFNALFAGKAVDIGWRLPGEFDAETQAGRG